MMRRDLFAIIEMDLKFNKTVGGFFLSVNNLNQRTNGPVNAHLISWPSKAQNIQNLEKYIVKK